METLVTASLLIYAPELHYLWLSMVVQDICMCILAQFFEKGLGENHVFFDLSSNFGFWGHPKFSDVEKSLLLQKPQKELFVFSLFPPFSYLGQLNLSLPEETLDVNALMQHRKEEKKAWGCEEKRELPTLLFSGDRFFPTPSPSYESLSFVYLFSILSAYVVYPRYGSAPSSQARLKVFQHPFP